MFEKGNEAEDAEAAAGETSAAESEASEAESEEDAEASLQNDNKQGGDEFQVTNTKTSLADLYDFCIDSCVSIVCSVETVVPERRNFVVKFKDITDADVSIKVNGREVKGTVSKCGKTLQVTVNARAAATIEITLDNCAYLKNIDKKTDLTRTISKFQMSTDYKGMVFTGFLRDGKELPKVDKDFEGPITEILKLYRD